MSTGESKTKAFWKEKREKSREREEKLEKSDKYDRLLSFKNKNEKDRSSTRINFEPPRNERVDHEKKGKTLRKKSAKMPHHCFPPQ